MGTMMKVSVQSTATICILLATILLPAAWCFCPSLRSQHNHILSKHWSTTVTTTETSSSPFTKLTDLVKKSFNDHKDAAGRFVPQPPSSPQVFVSTPVTLVAKAKAVIASDLAISPDFDTDILDEDFTWIGPYSYGKALGKQDYLAAGQFFDLRSTFPDLDYRAHDYRLSLDDQEPYTVRVTCRAVGTMRGPLRLRTETLPANGKRMICPPEAVSMTFDPATGKLTKLCSGFTMDRLVGNTKGLCGVMAAAVIAGSPPSEWDIYPPTTVVQRFFGRTVKQLPDNSLNNDQPLLAPFPETVMIQLAKGVIAANSGASDPDLLAPSFTFCGPIVGPLDKGTFVKAFGSFSLTDAFPDLDPKYTNFRVDPYDPYRVWFDVRATATNKGSFLGKEPTGKKVETPPEVNSLTFDNDGFCTRLTAGVVMDPSLGNTGGLGGVFGIAYAAGNPLPELVSRPLPEIVTRLQKRVVSLVTGADVDNYLIPIAPKPVVIPSANTAVVSLEKAAAVKAKSPPPKLPTPPAAALVASPKVSLKPIVSSLTLSKVVKSGSASTQSSAQKKSAVALKLSKTKIAPAEIDQNPTDPVSDIFKSMFGLGSKETKPIDEKVKSGPTLKKINPIVTSAKVSIAKASTDQKKKADQEVTLKGKADAAAKEALEKQKKERGMVEAKEKSLAAAVALKLKSGAAGKEALEKKKKEREAVQEQEKTQAAAALKANADTAAKEALEKQKKGREATQLKEKARAAAAALKEKADASSKAASEKQKSKTLTIPKGIPVLSKWKKNAGAAVTGMISGSPSFKDGEAITTSSIVEGEIKPGNVVQTKSGSKYFLS